jgi:hypothetical protein
MLMMMLEVLCLVWASLPPAAAAGWATLASTGRAGLESYQTRDVLLMLLQVVLPQLLSCLQVVLPQLLSCLQVALPRQHHQLRHSHHDCRTCHVCCQTADPAGHQTHRHQQRCKMVSSTTMHSTFTEVCHTAR